MRSVQAHERNTHVYRFIVIHTQQNIIYIHKHTHIYFLDCRYGLFLNHLDRCMHKCRPCNMYLKAMSFMPFPNTYLPSRFTVMQVHRWQHFALLARGVSDGDVQELSAEPHAVLDVVGAAAPVPAFAGGAAVLQGGVTGALRHVAGAARPGHSVHQARSHHRIDKRCLLGA